MATGNASPLGFGSFALTTFVLSCYTAGIFGVRTTDPVNVVTGLALFYGGLGQILAGLWELAEGNTFLGTVFTSYAAFWLSNAAILIPAFGVAMGYRNFPDTVLLHAAGIYMLSWAIFTFLMLLASLRTTVGLVLLFTGLTVTFSLLAAADFGTESVGNVGIVTQRAGGFCGIITAVIAWYNAFASLLAKQINPLFRLPVGDLHGRWLKVSSSG